MGVGALAGSTIMLLTIPWALSVYGGRVDLDSNGNANYKRTPKLSPDGFWSLSGSGVVISHHVRIGGWYEAHYYTIVLYFYHYS